MSSQPLSSDWTSAKFEQVALSRLRSRVSFLPKDCRIFREPWDCSTVLCLDFSKCPNFLEVTQHNSAQLQSVVQELGLGHAIVFRLEHKLMGWVGID